MLHITNGACAVQVLGRAVEGAILPWRDVLHEGPVHAGLPLAELSRRRAAFIASAGWGSSSEVLESFRRRDERLAAAATEDEIVLWFEHDLYDQLQLLQLLDWFAARPHPRLSLVCEAEYLGTMTPARAAELFRSRRSMTSQDLRAGSAAWGAFGSGDPRNIALEPLARLPFVAPALQRLLEEYPWTTDGLSRLERQVLEALRGGPLGFEELYARAHHNREDPVWLGDAVLDWHLERLAADGLLFKSDVCAISERGNKVLDGRLDGWAFPRRHRWIGGCEVRNGRMRWDDTVKGVRAIF
jgi:hypothetical protein